MLGLLLILTAAVVTGKLARRMTLGVELLLLLFVAAVVLGEFLYWSGHATTPAAQMSHWLFPGR